MIEKIIAFALSQRLIAVFVALLLGVGGTYAFKKLTIDAFPDVSPVQVKMIFKAPGLTPKEVEQQILIPVELEMQGIPHQKMVRSIAKYAFADITIDFEDGTDIYWARNVVHQRLARIKEELPKGVETMMAPITTPLGEVLMFTIESDSLSLQEKRTLLDWVIRPQLRSVPGVADINSLGGYVKTYEIRPDFSKMAALGIDLKGLETKLTKNNANFGAGRIERGDEAILVRLSGRFTSIEEIKNLIVKNEDDTLIRLKDIAQVRIGSLTRYGYVTKDGKSEAVEGLVLALRGADASKITREIKKRLQEIQKQLPKGTRIEIFYDRGELVSKAVAMVQKALLEAVGLVFVILLLFLGSIVSAITVAIILPLAILSAFLLMYYFGLSLNLMSLGGIVIAIGMIVDSGVVMVENIVARLAQSEGHRLHLILEAAKEVSVPIIAGVLIIITIFTPLLTLSGLGGKLFAPVALSIIFTLFSSILLALFVIPTFASFFIKKPRHSETPLMRFFLKIYEPFLKAAFKMEYLVYAILVVALAGTFYAFAKIGKTFMPTMDEGNIVIGMEAPPSINIEAGKRLNLSIQRKLMQKVPEIKSIIARTGSDEIGMDPMGLNDTDTFLVLKPKSQWRKSDVEWLKDRMREVLESFTGIEYSFTQPIQMRTSEMLTGSRGDVVVKLFGEDMQELDRLGAKIKQIVQKTPGSKDVYMRKNEGVAYYELHFNEEQLGRYGLDKEDVAHLLKVAIDGEPVGTIYEGLKRFFLTIKGGYSKKNFNELYILSADGKPIFLRELVSLKRVGGPVEIKHEAARRYVTIQTNVEGRDLVSFVNDLKTSIDKLKLPVGYSVRFEGEFKDQQETMKRLSVMVPTALFAIFIILYLTFSSLKQAAMIFATIPLAMIGGVFGLYITHNYLSVPASVGFIALLGIAVLNGVVLVSYFNELLLKMELDRVVIEGAKRRLRPVLMTASIAAFSLVPMLYATGPGSEIQKPLAIVVIFGLVTSTSLTLILLPLLYRRFMKA